MKRIVALIGLLVLLAVPSVALAQSSREVRAKDVKILLQEGGDMVFSAKGADGETYVVDTADGYFEGPRYDIREGSEVILQVNEADDGSRTVLVIDVVRTGRVALIFLLFALVTIAVGLWRGVFALVGLAFTLAVIFGFIFPRVLGGADPVGTTVVGSIAILAVNMHVAHGFSRRTFAAFMSTVAGLLLAWLFAKVFIVMTSLSGLASEEAAQVFLGSSRTLAPKGILLSGILLGAVGVLDDIAITQTEVVTELEHSDPSLSRRALYVQAMRVGRHHIASVVNTLVLAYAGASMALFLLFMQLPNVDLWRFMNDSVVVEEIVRTMAGTMALILLVPIATLGAVLVPTRHGARGHHREHI